MSSLANGSLKKQDEEAAEDLEENDNDVADENAADDNKEMGE